METVFVLLIAAVVLVLTWTWWSARSERDPASSVDTFRSALTAMQPGTESERRAAAGITATPARADAASDDTDAGA